MADETDRIIERARITTWFAGDQDQRRAIVRETARDFIWWLQTQSMQPIGEKVLEAARRHYGVSDADTD